MGTYVDKILCISSYNSTGFGIAAKNYIQTLLLFSDILCIQEHFLLDCKDKKLSNTNKLVKELGSNHDMHIVPAFKDNSQVSRGRGQGGLVTLFRKELTKYVSKIDSPNFRILASKFAFPSISFLVVNVYFPCDPQVDQFDEKELITLLADLQIVIDKSGCFNVLIAGDFNSDFSRKTRFTEIVEEYLSEKQLIVFWQNTDPNPRHNIENVDYT